MKKRQLACLLLSSFVCLSAAGCGQSANSVHSAAHSNAQSASTSTVAAESGDSGAPTSGLVVPGEDFAPSAGSQEPEESGKVRIDYTVNRNGVKYVTSPDQLPDYEGLSQYDADFFAQHALLLVLETVSSGSVEVDIQSIDISDGTGTVTLSHQLPEGAVGTADMTTWCLWTVVEQDLDCTWVLANPALESDLVDQ